MEDSEKIANDLIKLIKKVMSNKTYGSVEIYFEGGNITQITQRIINKVSRLKKEKNPEKPQGKRTSEKVAHHHKTEDSPDVNTITNSF